VSKRTAIASAAIATGLFLVSALLSLPAAIDGASYAITTTTICTLMAAVMAGLLVKAIRRSSEL
jgi:hypothetical protein